MTYCELILAFKLLEVVFNTVVTLSSSPVHTLFVHYMITMSVCCQLSSSQAYLFLPSDHRSDNLE